MREFHTDLQTVMEGILELRERHNLPGEQYNHALTLLVSVIQKAEGESAFRYLLNDSRIWLQKLEGNRTRACRGDMPDQPFPVPSSGREQSSADESGETPPTAEMLSDWRYHVDQIRYQRVNRGRTIKESLERAIELVTDQSIKKQLAEALQLFKSNSAGHTKRAAVAVLDKCGGYTDPREAKSTNRKRSLKMEADQRKRRAHDLFLTDDGHMCAIADGPLSEDGKPVKVVPFIGDEPVIPSWQDCLEKLKCLRTKHGSRIKMYIRRAVELADDPFVKERLQVIEATMKVSSAGPPKKRALEILADWVETHSEEEPIAAAPGPFTIPKKNKKPTLVLNKKDTYTTTTKPTIKLKFKRTLSPETHGVEQPTKRIRIEENLPPAPPPLDLEGSWNFGSLDVIDDEDDDDEIDPGYEDESEVNAENDYSQVDVFYEEPDASQSFADEQMFSDDGDSDADFI